MMLLYLRFSVLDAITTRIGDKLQVSEHLRLRANEPELNSRLCDCRLIASKIPDENIKSI